MKHVLIVDDDPTVCTLLTTFLSGHGHRAEAVPDGQSALEWLTCHQTNILLLDLLMPGMSGLEVLQEVNRRYPGLPVIVLSGCDDEDLARQALRLGAYDFFQKPLSLAVVEERIQTKLLLMEYPSVET